jgi:hypothetical protein
MKITVDEQGKIDPPNSAGILSIVNESATVPEGGAIPETPIAWRNFQCNECNGTFEARAGQTTVHDCPE